MELSSNLAAAFAQYLPSHTRTHA